MDYNKYKNKTLKKMSKYSTEQLIKVKAYYFYNKQYLSPSFEKLDEINKKLDNLKPANPKKGRPRKVTSSLILKIKKLKNKGKKRSEIAKELKLNARVIEGIIYNYITKKGVKK